ncbi:Ada metal-binding domain-containing protein [Butyrivibrio sp. VCB2001]|uniref:Ada metal-binding domain-containing protein n=1 Tax=Butyrivibrio sp. VCB2001 TaxID=1280667 RepID=UPI0003F65705|nr:Ada metal-binding domain-containing protein [Butyrivibrio sp. VCB2001]
MQPGVIINYSNGSNKADPNYKKSVSADEFVVKGGNSGTTVNRSTPAQSDNTTPAGTTYVVNKNSNKFHNPTCDSVKDMKEKNKMYYEGTRDELIQQGYDPCKRCNP